jgi:hypothetical protein
MDKITQILENVVRCKYFEAGVHIKNPIKNSYQVGLGRTTQTLDHVVVVHILIWDKRKSQINEYSDLCNFLKFHKFVGSYLCYAMNLVCRSNLHVWNLDKVYLTTFSKIYLKTFSNTRSVPGVQFCCKVYFVRLKTRQCGDNDIHKLSNDWICYWHCLPSYMMKGIVWAAIDNGKIHTWCNIICLPWFECVWGMIRPTSWERLCQEW